MNSARMRRPGWLATVAAVLALAATAVALVRARDGSPQPDRERPGSGVRPGVGGGTGPVDPEARAAQPTDFHAYSTHRDFSSGHRDGGITLTDEGDGALTLAQGTTAGTWTSPEHAPPGGFAELVPSWQADTPPGSWLEVGMQARTASTTSRWYVMGVWALDSSAVTRHSVREQDDHVGTIYTDTFRAHGPAPAGMPVAYRLRVTLHGTPGARPVLRQLAAAASLPGSVPDAASPTSMQSTVDLPVPAYSQATHAGEHPVYGGGGEAWCSPTSTAMVIAYYGRGPSAADLARLPPDPVFDRRRADAVVNHAAIHTYDAVHQGTGNWPFNTAYASAYGLDGSVRRYSSLRPVEDWITTGVPVVVSLAWDNGDSDPMNDLGGASILSTDGHLMVIRGFTTTGDVIANDPASATNAAVRRVYPRAQVERNWLRASGGTTYVIRP